MPRVEERLRALGVTVRAHTTRSLEHAGDLARAAAAEDRVSVTLRRRRARRARSRAPCAACPARCSACCPAGVATTSRAPSGCRCDPLAACDVIARGRPRRIDLGEAGTRAFVTIASLGVDSEANRLAAAGGGPRGRLVYLLAALRATATWRPAAFAITLDDGRAVRYPRVDRRRRQRLVLRRRDAPRAGRSRR